MKEKSASRARLRCRPQEGDTCYEIQRKILDKSSTFPCGIEPLGKDLSSPFIRAPSGAGYFGRCWINHVSSHRVGRIRHPMRKVAQRRKISSVIASECVRAWWHLYSLKLDQFARKDNYIYTVSGIYRSVKPAQQSLKADTL